MIDLVVTLAIFAVLAATAIPHFDSRRMHIGTAQRVVIANLRLARANAVAKSVHFKVDFPSLNQLRVARMQLAGDVWQVDSQGVQTLTLPSATQLGPGTMGTSVEFNTRGLAINLTQPEQIVVVDDLGMSKSLQVWPSGQVNEL